MSYLDQMKEENEAVEERYELAMERIGTMLDESEETWLFKGENKEFFLYFNTVKKYLLNIQKAYSLVATGKTKSMSVEALQELNHGLFASLGLDTKEAYQESFLNPEYAVSRLGKKMESC